LRDGGLSDGGGRGSEAGGLQELTTFHGAPLERVGSRCNPLR
jgi:hypothetical protein